ncbi:MAG: putative toxin-antitoxin system toxin component, PIN family [Candidatus Eremiobacterota bacterium]
MTIKTTPKKLRVFLDANCYIAAAGSPDGGSFLIFKLARAGYIEIITTQKLLQEAKCNIERKMDEKFMHGYYEVLKSTDIEIMEPVTVEEEFQWEFCTHKKDCHVLAAAYKAKADVLVSLDIKHIVSDKVKKNFPIPVKNTKSFLTDFLSGK